MDKYTERFVMVSCGAIIAAPIWGILNYILPDTSFYRWVTLEPLESSAIIRNYGLVFAALIAFPFVFWRARSADKQAKAAAEQAIQGLKQTQTAIGNQTFAQFERGVMLLDSDSGIARNAGLYTLEQVAKFDEYHYRILSALATFITDCPPPNYPAPSDDIDLNEFSVALRVFTNVRKQSNATHLLQFRRKIITKIHMNQHFMEFVACTITGDDDDDEWRGYRPTTKAFLPSAFRNCTFENFSFDGLRFKDPVISTLFDNCTFDSVIAANFLTRKPNQWKGITTITHSNLSVDKFGRCKTDGIASICNVLDQIDFNNRNEGNWFWSDGAPILDDNFVLSGKVAVIDAQMRPNSCLDHFPTGREMKEWRIEPEIWFQRRDKVDR